MNVQEGAPLAELREVMHSSAGNSTLTDENFLVSGAKSGCSDAFGELCGCHRLRIYHSVLQILGNRQDTEDDDGLSMFLSTQARLLGIANRILKNAADAEDLVQDVWVRWQTTDRSTVRDAAAFLMTMTTRLAINVVRSARSRRETSFGSSLQESVDTCPDPRVAAECSEKLRGAVFLLLEKLSPAERAAYVLREAFDYSYREIASVLRLKEANARQLTGPGWRALLQQARHKERLRIARELHDTLLQRFISAWMQLCLVDEWLPADSPAKPILRRTLDLIRKGLDEARGALLGVRSPALAEGSLEKTLGDFRDDLAPGGTTRLSIAILGESRPLTPAAKEQIYWIAREALLNALRHSAASRVEAEIEYLPRKLRVVVRDDGTGIDPKALRIGRTSHWGLTGMQERAASIGAKVRVWSKQGGGTEVKSRCRSMGLGNRLERRSKSI